MGWVRKNDAPHASFLHARLSSFSNFGAFTLSAPPTANGLSRNTSPFSDWIKEISSYELKLNTAARLANTSCMMGSPVTASTCRMPS